MRKNNPVSPHINVNTFSPTFFLMNAKQGVTAVIFDEANSKRYFLVLHRILNWSGWEFVKGGIDEGETPEAAVLREIEEEAGLKKVFIVKEFPSKVTWIAKDTKYIYTPFVLRANMNEPVDLSQEIIEHDNFIWLEQDKVETILTHEDNKRIFRETLEILGG